MAVDRERERTYQREWARRRRKDPAYRKVLSLKSRKWQKAHPLSSAWTLYQGSAARRGIAFALPRALFDDLISDCCFYCGAHPSPINGIDRVDNEKGYEYGNVVTACRRCNLAKRDVGLGDFAQWATQLSAHLPRWVTLSKGV